jgi:hypothetical protein
MKIFPFNKKEFLAYFLPSLLLGCALAPTIINYFKLQKIYIYYSKVYLSHNPINPGEIVFLKLCRPSKTEKISGLKRANVLLEVKLPSGINYVVDSATVPPTEVASNTSGNTVLEWNIGTQDLTKDFYEIEFSGIIRPDATIDSISDIEYFIHLVEQRYLKYHQIESQKLIFSNRRQTCQNKNRV